MSSSAAASAARRVALVTGGNKGIGLQVVRQLASADSNLLVLLGSRDAQRGQEAAAGLGLANVQPFAIDVTSAPSIRAAAASFQQQHPQGLDLLVNNAGVFLKGGDDTSGKREIIQATLAVNYYGPRDTIKAFWPLLNKNARVVNVSSQLSVPALSNCSPAIQSAWNASDLSVEKIDSLVSDFESAGAEAAAKGWASSAYGVSKVAVSALTRVLAREAADKEADRNITLNSACPGWCRTDMTSKDATRSAEEGGSMIVHVATLPASDKTSGEFWQNKSISKLFHVQKAA